MTAFKARVLTSDRHVLAEGPVWASATNTLLWVDVERGEVFEGVIEGTAVRQTRVERFDGKVGAVVPGEGGRLLVAGHERLVVVETDGSRTLGPVIVDDVTDSRTNDGAVDPHGRLLIGTIAHDELGGHDRLFRIEDDGSRTTLDRDLSISNGIAFSPDGRTLYNADTLRGTIWGRKYDPTTGEVGERREQLRIDGYPDGICVDAHGDIWIAVWASGEVRCYSPAGELRHVVSVPAPHVSSVAFVGPALDRLLITTASRDLDDAGLAEHPDAGRLFIVDVGVVGTPTYSWSGSWGPTAIRPTP